MPVVSVDLAYRSYSDIGVCVLTSLGGTINAEFVPLEPLELAAPTPEQVASRCLELCAKVGARLLLLDGPQGWKDPDNGLAHARVCEGALNTPGKTGLPGITKPANYAPFIRFAIGVFDALHEAGWPRVPDANGENLPARTAVETFPLSAWRTLGLRPLPSKAKSRPTDLQSGLTALVHMFDLRVHGTPDHDQLQALVAGLGGIALELGATDGYRLVGSPPYRHDGTWREGYILNPLAPRPRPFGST
jgi:hypothetical protein